ncbi:homologous-pairing protein 2 homolog [Pectinophora gossypiella]|uniref:homologous-pairing protein 2 homolog n=1 Tax=Pectinophora gossypiella TaxID=13191 RepID=UPI00214EC0A1|nr:homologous-pairing protein 2 homolog [Pectinophora gossypiella]
MTDSDKGIGWIIPSKICVQKDVTVNLRGAYTKGVVQKALDALSESGKIKCKLYGKQKVYAAIQTDKVEGDSDVQDYDAQMKVLTENLSKTTETLRTAEVTLKGLTATPTSAAAKCQIEEIMKTIDNLEKKLATLKDSKEVVSAEEKKAILGEHDKLLREYRRRKRISSDMLETILEGYPKPKKTLLEELCLETDEMVNFKLTSNT